MKKILIVAPHQDDELNLAGAFLKQLKNTDAELNIIFTTNGDYYPGTVWERAACAKKNTELYGCCRVIWLGYGDSLTGPHIYHSLGRDTVTSEAGRTETYAPEPFTDYRYETSGTHSPYTRSSMKKDLKDAVYEIRPELIFCIDCDEHPDHRCTALLCDEALKELYLENNYAPVLLKKFAYCGTWFGKPDYFTSPVLPTDLHGFHEDTDEHNCFPYLWEERIRVASDEEILAMNYRRSFLYRGLKNYYTENAVEQFEGIANSDSLFWYRSLKNPALKAEISASSGDPSCLNDFKLLDYSDVSDIRSRVSGLSGFWKPDLSDRAPSITIKLKEKASIREMRIHQSAPGMGRIRKIRLSTDEGSPEEIMLSGEYVNIVPLSGKAVDTVRIGLGCFDADCGIREIELFEEKPDFGYTVPGTGEFRENDIQVSWLKCRLSRLCFRIRIRIRRFARKLIGKLKKIISAGE